MSMLCKKLLLTVLIIGLLLVSSFAEDIIVKVKENIRSSPNGTKIGTLNPGTKIEKIEKSGKWIKFKLEGWIWGPSAKIISVPKTQIKRENPAAKLQKVMKQTEFWTVKYRLTTVKDEIKMTAMEGSLTDLGSGDLSLIRRYDEANWEVQFEKVSYLIHCVASKAGVDVDRQWYAKKKLWEDWFNFSSEIASKLASNGYWQNEFEQLKFAQIQ